MKDYLMCDCTKLSPLSIIAVALALTLLPGCKSEVPATPKSSLPSAPTADEGHSHERGKMMLADAGKYHALLTAHLSAKGNELDFFFETVADKPPKPVTLPLKSFTAQAKTSDGRLEKLEFEPAPLDERKDDKPDTCSHFVAKAPWMKADDDLYVSVKLTLDGAEESIRWRNFNPKKYAHHEE